MCGYEDVTVAGTAGYLSLVTYYTSDGHGFNAIGIPSATNSVTTQWAVYQGCVNFYADAGQPIKWAMSGTAVAGTPSVRYSLTLEQLQ